MSNDDVQSALVAAINSLNLRPDSIANVESEARNLAMVATLMGMNDRPLARDTGAATAHEQIKRIGALAVKLADQIGEANGNVRRGIQGEDRSIAFPILEAQLIDLAAAADRALQQSIGTNSGKGRPVNQKAKAASDYAARIFERGTGSAPRLWRDSEGNATGPFFKFIREVFDALDIDASPEDQARRISQERNPQN